MNNDRAIPEECTRTAGSGEVEIGVSGCERVGGDVAKFSTEIADLTGLRLTGVTNWIFTTDERIEMGKCLGAVAIGRDRLIMNVVDWARLAMIS